MSVVAEVGRRTPAESGTWVLLLGDMAVFAVFFATFMVERSTAPHVFDTARRTLHTGVGLANTLVLLTSSLFVVVTVGALRVQASLTARRASLAAIGCGLVFICLKVFEYTALIASGFTPVVNDFYLYYSILRGSICSTCVSVSEHWVSS